MDSFCRGHRFAYMGECWSRPALEKALYFSRRMLIMNQEPSNKTLIAAIIGATAIIVAAIIGLVSPFVENWAARYSPAFTPTVGSIASPQVIVVTATLLPQDVYN